MFEKYIGVPLKTRGGDEAIVFSVLEDAEGARLFGAYKDNGVWVPSDWYLTGYWVKDNKSTTRDLMLPKRKFWVVWPSDFKRPSIFDDEFAAKKFAEFHEFPFAEYEEP